MTLDQNKKNIRWGLIAMGVAIAWGCILVQLLSPASSDAFKWFSLISLSMLVFATFFLLFVYDVMPRYVKYLMHAEILTDRQLEGLESLPKIDESYQ